MNLSNQAIGAIMMALQKSLLEQSDIVPVLQGFMLAHSDNGLVVINAPTFSVDSDTSSEEVEHHSV